MHPAVAIPIAVACAYLIGSIPFGLLVARAVGGIDIRKAGSGNIGATNVGRVLGARWGILVLALDALKGALPSLLLPLALLTDGPMRRHAAVACGIATVAGHMFPCWLGFRGGKGVATALGVVLVLAPWGSAIATAAFVLVFSLSRIVSLSSIVASLAFAVGQLVLLRPSPFNAENWSLAAFSLVAPALIILRHRSNILRLWRGEEKPFRAAGPSTPSSEAPSDKSR